MTLTRYSSAYFLILAIIFFAPILAKAAQPDPNFNPNYIISDYDITDYNTMDMAQIQNFLSSHNSGLTNFTCVDRDGKYLKAAEAIYNIAQTNKINPRFLLVLLQKEQGLIENPNPKARALDAATGYGCPDSGGCNPLWSGFWKQVNSASLQFIHYLENYRNSTEQPKEICEREPGECVYQYTYKKGGTYTFTNPYTKETIVVTPINQATAALYNYTPHVYDGNYNFWKLWRRYFSKSYTNGNLVQVAGEPGVWLLQDGKRRAFLSKGALTSRFDINKVVTINKADLLSYPIGTPIKFPQYAIVKSPSGSLFLLVDNKKRGFVDKEAFKKLGYNPEEILNASWEDLQSYLDAPSITADDAYPTGALLQDKKTGGVFWVEAKTKAPIPDAIFLKLKFKNKKIIKVSATELNKYPTVSSIKFSDGELIKIKGGFGVYIVEAGALRPIDSASTFETMGYKKENIIEIPEKLFLTYPIGSPVSANQ